MAEWGPSPEDPEDPGFFELMWGGIVLFAIIGGIALLLGAVDAIT